MYDTIMRMEKVKQRVNILQRKRENSLITKMSALCLVLMGSLVKVILARSGGGQGYVTGLYGTTMLFEDAGGYVMVGVITFIIAVVITVLCIRYLERRKKIQDKQEKNR